MGGTFVTGEKCVETRLPVAAATVAKKGQRRRHFHAHSMKLNYVQSGLRRICDPMTAARH